MSWWSPPHDECQSCRFFNRQRQNMRCKFCGAGEFFEEKTEESRPDTTELMKLYEQMTEEAQVVSEQTALTNIHGDDDDDE